MYEINYVFPPSLGLFNLFVKNMLKVVLNQENVAHFEYECLYFCLTFSDSIAELFLCLLIRKCCYKWRTSTIF